MNDSRPAFLITIDTEADNLWARSHSISTRNATFLPRFQGLCERYGFKPTYLTDWDMAHSPVFREFARDLLARGAGEIGMHLHAWSTPPIEPLSSDDSVNHPYLIEFPEPLMREKVKVLTGFLEQTFGVKMLSHRAGRWAFDQTYARILLEHGYRVDCSVTPHTSWKAYKGDPNGDGGSDYADFPEDAYFLDLRDISRPGNSPLLELPITVLPPYYSAAALCCRCILNCGGRFGHRVCERFFPTFGRLIPSGRNLRTMRSVVTQAHLQKRDYVEFMLHSSEFMPGGSPSFPDAPGIERLYDQLEALFDVVSHFFRGRTLTEYRQDFCASHAQASLATSSSRSIALAWSPARAQT